MDVVGALLALEVVLHHVAVALLLDALRQSVQHLATNSTGEENILSLVKVSSTCWWVVS